MQNATQEAASCDLPVQSRLRLRPGDGAASSTWCSGDLPIARDPIPWIRVAPLNWPKQPRSLASGIITSARQAAPVLYFFFNYCWSLGAGSTRLITLGLTDFGFCARGDSGPRHLLLEGLPSAIWDGRAQRLLFKLGFSSYSCSYIMSNELAVGRTSRYCRREDFIPQRVRGFWF